LPALSYSPGIPVKALILLEFRGFFCGFKKYCAICRFCLRFAGT
jgi:hypothetical protein